MEEYADAREIGLALDRRLPGVSRARRRLIWRARLKAALRRFVVWFRGDAPGLFPPQREDER